MDIESPWCPGLNKLDWIQFEPDWMGPQCQKLDQLGSGRWALVNLMLKFVYWEKGTNFAKSSPYFCLQYIQTKVRGRFHKILWPSQNIWTLNPFASRRSWIDSDANEVIDIADSAGSSVKMSSSFTMQRATDALLDYWIIDCYQKLLFRFRLELKLQNWHSNSPFSPDTGQSLASLLLSRQVIF
mgnify:CR=1 FL=1